MELCFIADLPGEHNFLEEVIQVTCLFKEPPSLAYADGNSNTIHILPNPGKLFLQRFKEKYAHLCVEDTSRLKSYSFFVLTDQDQTTFYSDKNEEHIDDGHKLLRNFHRFCTDRAQIWLKYSDLVKQTDKSVDPLSECPHQIQQQTKRSPNVFPLSPFCLVPESREQASAVNQLSGECSMSRKQEQFSGSLQNDTSDTTVSLLAERNVESNQVERAQTFNVETNTDVHCSPFIYKNSVFDTDTGTHVSEYTRDAVKVEKEIKEKTCGAIKLKDPRTRRMTNDRHRQNAEQDQCVVYIDETATQHNKAKNNNHPLSKAGKAKYTLLVGLYIMFSTISSLLSVVEKMRRNSKITPTPELQQTGLKGRLREILDFPAQRIHFTDIFAYSAKWRGCNTGNFSRAQLQRQVQQQQQEQQAAEQPRHPIQCTEGSEIQDRESRNYDIVTSTRPVFSDRDSATATNAPLPVIPTLNIPYAQERALLDRVQGQGQHGTAAGGGRTTPRHPQYQDQTARQRSFTNWPASTHQAPARMIVFGFFYTGREDLVRCYHCGIGLKYFSDGDEPLFEHIKHSPNCLFLRELLGEQLLNTYRENLAESQRNNETARSQGSEPRPAQQPTRRVRHPGMTTLAQRLDTFNEWPQSTGQQPEALANAGLFFTGIRDLCRCFTCDGGLRRWDREDDPWVEHARWFPNCSYVREIKGQDYIDMVQAPVQLAQLDEERPVGVREQPNLHFQNTELNQNSGRLRIKNVIDCDSCNYTDVHLKKSSTTDMNMEFIADLPGEHNFLEEVIQVTCLFKEPPSLAYADGNSNTIHILPNPGKLFLQKFQEKYAHLCVEDASRLKSFFVMTDQEQTTFFNDENEDNMDGSKLLRNFNLFCSDRAQVRLKYSDLVKRTDKSVDPLSECPHQVLQHSNVVPLASLCLVPESREQASVVNQLSGDFSMSRTGPLVKLTRDAVKDKQKTNEKEGKTCGAIKRKDTHSSRLITDVHGQNAEQDQCTVHINETATHHTKAKSNNHPLSKAGRAKDTSMIILSVVEKIRRNAKISSFYEQQQLGLKGRLQEILDFPEKSFHFTDIFVCPLYNTGFFSRAQLQQQAQEQQQEQQAEEQPGTAGGCRTPPRHQQQEAQQQAEEQPRYPIQCTEGSEIQDRESRNYDIVTSTRPVFSDRDSATATNTPLTVTPTLNIPYAQERDLLDRVQGQGQYGTAGGGRTTPRHPQCQDQMARQRSFTNWPATSHQAPARMVVYGLFYTGQQDLVRCYHCGIGLKDWSDGDEPLFEHIRHSPNCLFLRQLFGEQLLNTYRENLEEAQRPNETARSQGSEPRPAQQHARRVRHPGMTAMAQRLGTFNEWLQSNGQQPEALANAGLFFTGINDLCRCFTCDGGLQRWDGEDDPWLEHARWFPHCSYVREIKGQDYIDMVQAAAQRAQLEEEESVVVRGLTNLDFQNTDPIETEAAKAVLDMGYSRAAVRLAIHEFNGRNPSQRTLRFTADELVQILVGRQERGEPIPDDDNDPEEKGASASAAQNLPSDPMEENKRLKGILKCIDCKENDCNILLLPCTHHRLCEPCAEKVTNCPVCQRRVEERVRTYMA